MVFNKRNPGASGARVLRARSMSNLALAIPSQGRTTSAGSIVSTPLAGQQVCEGEWF